jgi:hypothetical protein
MGSEIFLILNPYGKIWIRCKTFQIPVILVKIKTYFDSKV